MSQYVNITPEQRRYIVEHYGKVPVLKMAAKFGVCDMTIYRIIKSGGVDTKKHYVPLQKEELEKVIELYPNTPNKEIARIINRKLGTIKHLKRLYGLKKTPEYKYLARIDNLKKADPAKVRIAAKIGFQKKYKRAVFEKLSGMKPTTKMKVTILPKRIYSVMYRLRRIYNYFLVKGEPYTLYYDKDTKRCKREDYYFNKYRIKFAKAEEEEVDICNEKKEERGGLKTISPFVLKF